jgi:hypothetical protein
MSQPNRPDRPLGDVATRLLFENERVRVWQMKLEPDAESATHRHDLDYLLVQVAGDRIAAVPEPDSRGPYTEYFESDVKPGRTVFISRGGVETARNVGAETYREILIELKD